jgi:hypothetical protein
MNRRWVPVAARRAVLDFPQASLRVPIHAEDVAMAHRPDFRRHAVSGFFGLVSHRIAGGRCAVEIEAHDLAQRGGGILRGLHLLPLAAGDVEVLAIGRDSDAVRVMPATGDLGRLAPDNGEAFNGAGGRGCADQHALADHRAAGVIRSRLGPA